MSTKTSTKPESTEEIEKRRPDVSLNSLCEAIRTFGVLSTDSLLTDFCGNPEPNVVAVQSLDERLSLDPRFMKCIDGWGLMGMPSIKSVGEMLSEAVKAEASPATTKEASTVPKADNIVTVEIKPLESALIKRLRAELRDLKSELAAHKDREAEGKALADDITKASGAVEAAKEVLAGKKAALATAHEELFLFTSGDTQMKINTSGDGDDEDLYAPRATASPIAEAVAPVVATTTTEPPKPFHEAMVPDQVIDDHGFSFSYLDAAMVREILPSEKPLAVGGKVIEARGCQWLVRDCNDQGTRFFAQRIMTKDEWQQTHESAYGRCVKGFDQSDEAKHHRQQGGKECGLMVKVGRKDGVLAPESEGIILVVDAPAVVGVDLASAGGDHSAEIEHKEPGEFVAGDTVGGVVHSNPND